MKNTISQKKAEEVRNRHLARQFPHVGRIIAERDAYKAALIAAGLTLPEVNPKQLTKSGPPIPKKVVAEVVEPESTPLPTEPEPVDEASAADWGDEPAPAEPAKKTAKKSAKK